MMLRALSSFETSLQRAPEKRKELDPAPESPPVKIPKIEDGSFHTFLSIEELLFLESLKEEEPPLAPIPESTFAQHTVIYRIPEGRKIRMKCGDTEIQGLSDSPMNLEKACTINAISFQEVVKIYQLGMQAFKLLKGAFDPLRNINNLSAFKPSKIHLRIEDGVISGYVLTKSHRNKQFKTFVTEYNINRNSKKWINYGAAHWIKHCLLELAKKYYANDAFAQKITEALGKIDDDSEITPFLLHKILIHL